MCSFRIGAASIRLAAAACCLLGSVFFAPPVRSATLTWTGGAGDNQVSNPLNWSPAQAPVNGDVLIFAGSVGLAPQLAGPLTVGSLTFKNTATAFTVGGAGTFTVNGGITNDSTSTETINTALRVGANQNWEANSGAMVVGGPVDLQTFTITSTGAKALTISGAISGAGGVKQNGKGSLTLSGNNLYTGATTLQAGTLFVGSDTAFGTGVFTVVGAGKLDAIGSARTLSNAISIDSNFTFLGSNALTFSGPVSLLRNSKITTNGVGTLSLNGVLTSTKTLEKIGTGTLALNGANGATFSGQLKLTAGRLIVGNTGATGTGTFTIANATIEAGGAARTIPNTLTLSGNPTFSGAYDLTFTGTPNFGAIRTLTVNNPTTAFTGNITGGGRGIIKAGPGVLVLSGANTYGSGTVIRDGTVVLDSNTAAGDPTKLITVGDVTVGSTTPATLLFSTTAGRTVANSISVPAGSTGLRTIGGLNTAGVNTFSGAVTLNSGVTLTAPAGGEVNFTGVVSGANGIIKTGAGTIRLSNANTFGGATLVSAGTLAYGASNALGAGSVTINGGILDLGANRTDSVGAVTLESGSILGTGTSALTSTSGFTVRSGSVSAILAGAVSLTKDTAGSVTLSGANTFTGGTNVNGGTLAFGASNVLVNSGAVIVSGGTLSIGAFSDTVGAVTLASGSILGSGGVLTGTGYTLQSGTVTAALGGAGINLTKNTADTVLMSGANSYTGTTTITAGTLRLGATETLPNATAVTMSAGTTLDLSSFSDTIGSLSGAGAVLLNTGRLTTGGDNTSTTFTGTISGNAGTGGLTKAGAGTFTISGTNAYGGSTDVNAGTLTLGNASAGPAASRVNVAPGATFNVAGYNATIGSLGGAGSVTLGAGTLAAGGDGTSSTFSGVISGSGGLTKSGAGTLTVSGTNTFSGGVTVAGGNFVLSGASGTAVNATSFSMLNGASLVLDNSTAENASRISTTAAINIQGGNLTFISDADGTSETVGQLNFLAGPSTITVVHNGTAVQSSALTFSSLGSAVTGSSLNFAATGGTLGSGLNGPHVYITGQPYGLIGGWARVGGDFAEYLIDGVTAFSNYYTGSDGINVNDPTKIVSLGGTSPVGAYTLTNAGTTTDGGLQLTDLALVDLNTSSARTLNLLNGGLIKKSAPDTTISGAGRLTAGGTAASGLYVAVETGRNLTIASSIINNAGPDGTYGNGDDGVVNILKSDAGTLVLGGANTFSGGIYINEGTISVSADANLGAPTNGVFLAGGTLGVTGGFTANAARRFVISTGLTSTIDVAGGQSLTLSGASDLLATGSTTSQLRKTGPGDLILTGANPNFTGIAQISSGAVELRNAGSLGSGSIVLAGGTLFLRADATMSFGNSVTVLADSTIVGSALTAGTPTLLLGSVTIGSQVLTLSANSGAILLLASANLTGAATFNATMGVTKLGAISGPNGFFKTGAGILELTSMSSHSGVTSVLDGTLELSDAAAIPLDSPVDVGAGGTVDLNGLAVNFGSIAGTGGIALGGGTLTIGGSLLSSSFGGVISGAGGLIKTGSEILTLSGANSYTGATTISDGSIRLGANNSLPATTSVAIATVASLDLSGRNLTIAKLTGSGSVILGTGTLSVGDATSATFSGDFSGAGSVVKIGTGTLTLNGTSSLTGAINVTGGTLEILTPGALGSSAGGTSVAAGSRITIAPGISIASEPLGLAGAGPAGNGALEIPTGTVSWNGPISLSAGATIGTGGALTLGGPVSLAGNVLSLTGTGNTMVSGIVSGAGGVSKVGTGTLTLAGANNFTGVLTVNEGRLIVQDNQALGAAGAGDETDVKAGATLELDSESGITTNEPVVIAGAGVLAAGAIQVTRGDNSLEGSVSLAANASVDVGSGSSLAFGAIGELSPGLSLTKTGAGILQLAGANTFTGTLFVDAGTLSTNADNRFNGLSGLSLAAGTTLDLNNFNDSLGDLSGAGTVSFGPVGGGTLTVGAKGTSTTFSGLITGTGDFVKAGTGTFSLTTSNSIPALTSVTVEGGGTLNIGTTTQSTGPVVISGSLSGTTGTFTAPTFELNDGNVSARLAGAASTLLVSGGYNQLSGSNTYGGVTQISGGTLEVLAGGAILGTGGVNVVAGTTLIAKGVVNGSLSVSGALEGTGTAAGNVAINAGGEISPAGGTAVGTLSTGPLTFGSGGAYRLTLNSSAVTADKVLTTGTISLGAGVASLLATDLFTQIVTHGTTLTILDSTAGVSGYFAGLPQGAIFMVGANTYQISYAADSGRDVTLMAIPEPSGILLILCGIAMLHLIRPRRNLRQTRPVAGR